MDTGKILMGMAMLLITIGLLVHPAGAAETVAFQRLGREMSSDTPGRTGMQ